MRAVATSLAGLLSAVIAAAAQPAAQDSATSSTEPRTFKVFVAGRELGEEQVSVSDTEAGTTITATGSLAPPLDILLQNAEVVYAPSGEAVRLSVNAVVQGTPVNLTTTFDEGEAASTIIEGEKTSTKTDAVSPKSRTVAQGLLFLGSYHALARDLSTTAQGASLKVYVAPVGEVDVNVGRVEEERIQTAGGTFDTKRVSVTVPSGQPNEPLAINLWTDGQGRLLRMVVPAQSLDVVREDLASVATRRITVWRNNDEDVRIAGDGFALAATVSKPRPPRLPASDDASEDGERDEREDERQDDRKYPAIVLVAGSGAYGRDATVFGIPFLGQLAGGLADAGYLVVRYDNRGAGQSGGRTESAALDDYAKDVLAVVRYVRDRDDVDDDRVAVVGHGEGAWIALRAAERENDIRAVVSMAGAATTGSELLLEQQQHLLSRMQLSNQERERKMAEQLTIQHAVLTGVDWDKVSEQVRRQSDTPMFRSILAYDPGDVIEEVEQPILILHGDLDKEVLPHHAEKLLALARTRDDERVADLTTFPDLNHLFVEARTGEVDEYAILRERDVSPEVAETIGQWLGRTFPPRR